MNIIILILLILCSIHFWGFVFIPQSVFNLTNAISLLIMGFGFLKVWHKKDLRFMYAIILFFIGLLINLFSAYINQQQSPLDTFKAFGTFYFILFYFFLHYLQINRKNLENIIIVFAIIYSVFYIIQVFTFPTEIFDSNMVVDRGTVRLRIEGNGFLVLAYFLVLNRFLLNLRITNLLLSLAFFVILLMGGFRTLTLATLFLSGFMYIKLVRFSFADFAILSLVVLMFFGLFQFEGTSKIVEGMTNSSKSEFHEGEKNIRVVAFEFFFKEFPKNNSVYIFGAGFPGFPSGYSYYLQALSKNFGLFWVDIGLFGFYIIVGIVALCGLLWYSLKAIFSKLPRNSLFLNIYFAYLVLVSFTTMEIYRGGIFAVEAIGLYLIDLAVTEYNQDKINYV
jgi:hypothetical protein